MEGSASQAGFYYQNNIAALKIIECLFFNSNILKIRLENYEKGKHIDDIIIYKKDKIEYYQVKWSIDEDKSYSVFNLLKSQYSPDGKVKRSLFKSLAEGYESVKNNSVNLSITLFTTKRESNQKRPSENIHYGLTDLRTNIFEPLQTGGCNYEDLPNYQDYQEILEKIRVECELDKPSFNEFLKCLVFRFRQEPTEEIQDIIKSKLDKLGIEIDLLDKLLNAVVKWSISGESITKDLLLKELNISDRFEDKLSHFFKIVDNEHYVSNKPFFNKLEESLSQLDNGYIFIEGLPGIGKSTALTKFKEKNNEVALTYYCFIPDTGNNFGEMRHQSHYFLKSLCINVEKQFPDVDLPGKYSHNYQEKFWGYLEKLSSLNRKIIFIIDGLDHVHRDSSSGERSLLNAITGSLPENIFMILSAQYPAVLSPSVKLSIDADERRHIKVLPFLQYEIKEYLNKKGIDHSEIIDDVEKVSAGIPVYLHYISEHLLKGDKSDYKEILKEFPILQNGEINHYHEYLFQKIKDDPFAKWILAVLAYRKENTSVEVLHEILTLANENRPLTDVENVVNSFSHLLKQTDARSFAIFHNSFREFVISKTLDLKEKFNLALVLYYKQNPFSDDAYRNYFNHLSEIGEYKTILAETNLDWMKSSWNNFRASAEIEENLEKAIKASIEISSLNEFIRICFLKDQFAQAKNNFDNSDIDFPTLLLDAGERANSLRSIWDGDFVLTNKEYFCYYLGKYKKMTGALLPPNVIQRGLGKSLTENNVKGITSSYKAEALVYENIVEIFQDISEITWISSERHNVNFKRKNYSKEANSETNLKIKLDVLDSLVEHREYKKLLLLMKSTESHSVFPHVQMSMVKLLLSMKTVKKDAVAILKKIDFSSVSDKRFLRFVSFCTKYLSNTEILQLFTFRDIALPELFDKVVNNKRLSFELRKEIVNLFKDLKYFWIFKPEDVENLMSETSFLESPAEDIYDSILLLSELWHKSRTENISTDESVSSFKECIDFLNVYRPDGFRPRASGLFDMDTDSTYIASGLKYLFKNIFELAIELLSADKIIEIAEYWITVDCDGNGYKHYSTGLEIAKVLKKSNQKELNDIIYKIIQHAESVAREELDTVSLTSNIGEVCRVYGICNFSNDFRRLYNQLIDISFGVGYRKDYQVTNILEPLSMMHTLDPDGTLKRLEEIFHIQNHLKGAGNGRMQHIALSNFIAFTAERYPELGFKLLQFEEASLGRNEAVKIVIDSLISKCEQKDLHLHFAAIKTLERWRDGSSSESTFIDLSKLLLSRAKFFSDEDMISSIIEMVKFNLLVELEDKKEMEKFTVFLIEEGITIEKYTLSQPKSDPHEETDDERQSLKLQKNVIPDNEIDLEKLLDLFDSDYEKFSGFIKDRYSLKLKEQRRRLFKKERRMFKTLFKDFYDGLALESRVIVDDNKYLIFNEFHKFQENFINFNPEKIITLKGFQKLFFSSVAELDSLFKDSVFSKHINEKINIKKWLENIFARIDWRKEDVFFSVLIDSDVRYLVENCSIFSIDNMLDFIKSWTRRSTRSEALLRIAVKLLDFDLQKAKEILSQVSQYEFESLLFQHEEASAKLDFDIFDAIFKVDESFGRKFLLESYFLQKGRYTRDLTYSLDKLLAYRKYFEAGAIEAYYAGNLIYNKELIRGLPPVENKYKFIGVHKESLDFSDIVIKNLIWLYNYPAMKIRELSLMSSLDLINNNRSYLNKFIKYGIDEGSYNEIEYTLTVLRAFATISPADLIKFKDQFFAVTEKKHYNILELVKDILFEINKSQNSFLTENERSKLKLLNSTGAMNLKNTPNSTFNLNQFIYSEFQRGLMRKLNMIDKEKSFYEEVFNQLVEKGWIDYNQQEENNVHQGYNINTNYDVIEIQSPYYDEFKAAINTVFFEKNSRGCFTPEAVVEARGLLRIFDPSDLLIKVTSRPADVSYINNKLSEEEFATFSDFDEIVANISGRNQNFVTLVDFGSQRTSGYKELNGTCYFEVKAFLKDKSFDLAKLKNYDSPEPFLSFDNKYAYEIPSLDDWSSSFHKSKLEPLLELSHSSFRGEEGLSKANLLNIVFSKLGVKSLNLLQILNCSENDDVYALNWISSYTAGPRWRRYKPGSEGFTLRIRKDLLLNYLIVNNLELCYNITLRRSTDDDRPEKYMRWTYFNKDVALGDL